MKESDEKIVVLLFDFDGAIYNDEYKEAYASYTGTYDEKSPESHPLIKCNKPLFDYIRKTYLEKGYKVKGRCISSRVTYDMDLSKRRAFGQAKTGSIFEDLPRICKYLGIELDTFLITDIAHELKSGTTFEEGKEALKQEQLSGKVTLDQRMCIVQESKRLNTYAHIQDEIEKNPGKDILFDMLDDNKNILSDLPKYYTSEKNLLTSHGEMAFTRYDGKPPESLAKVSGAGEPNPNYKPQIREILQNTKYQKEVALKDDFSITKALNPELDKKEEPEEKQEIKLRNVDDILAEKKRRKLEALRQQKIVPPPNPDLDTSKKPDSDTSKKQGFF